MKINLIDNRQYCSDPNLHLVAHCTIRAEGRRKNFPEERLTFELQLFLDQSVLIDFAVFGGYIREQKERKTTHVVILARRNVCLLFELRFWIKINRIPRPMNRQQSQIGTKKLFDV